MSKFGHEDDLQELRGVRETLFWIRKDKGLSLSQMARRMGYTTKGGVSDLESCRVDDIRMSTLMRHARALGYRIGLSIEKVKNDADEG